MSEHDEDGFCVGCEIGEMLKKCRTEGVPLPVMIGELTEARDQLVGLLLEQLEPTQDNHPIPPVVH